MNEIDYPENLNIYTKNINLAIKVSTLAKGRQVEDKVFWACVLFTKMCVTGMSIFVLSPNSEVATEKIEHWDFSSLFSLTRNLMESYQTLFYLCIDKITDNERKARRKLFNLHDYYSRKKLFSFTSEPIEDKDIEELVIRELKETEYFKNLPEKQQQHFLKGEHSFFISREDIEEKTGTNRDDFKFIYKLLSSNTHTFPMGFYRMMDGERGTGVRSKTEVAYSSYALYISSHYLVEATKNMLVFFPDILKTLTKDEVALLPK